MAEAEVGRRVLSIILPDPMYNRVVRLARHQRFRKKNQVILECVRRALPTVETDYPPEEEGREN